MKIVVYNWNILFFGNIKRSPTLLKNISKSVIMPIVLMDDQGNTISLENYQKNFLSVEPQAKIFWRLSKQETKMFIKLIPITNH